MITERQAKEISHAIGLDGVNRRPFRNYYNSSVDCDSWNDLVGRGLAIRRETPKSMGGVYYHLTEKGLEFVFNNRDTFEFDGRIKKAKTLINLCN